MKRITDNKGFTLIELLIVLGIMGSIFGVMAMTIGMIYQTYNVGFDKSLALKQVDLASAMISKDINRASNVDPQLPYGFPLILTCYDWNDDLTAIGEQTVTYKYDINESTITRETSKVGEPNTNVIIARYITSPPGTKIDPQEPTIENDTYTYTITIKAEIPDREESAASGNYTAQQRVPASP